MRGEWLRREEGFCLVKNFESIRERNLVES